MSSLANIFASVAGNESTELDPALVQIVEVSAEEAAEAIVDKEIAEHDKDIAEHEHCIDKLETAIEAVEEKQEELEDIVDGLESMMSGGTDFNAALFHDRLTRGAKISAKFGAPLELQGAESYSDASTAALNALAGIESMKEVAGKAAGAAKKFFIELYNGFIALITGVFNRFKGIEKKAALAKQAVSSKGEDHFKGEVTRSGAARWVDASGHAPKVVDSIIAAGNTLSNSLDTVNAGGIVDGIDRVIDKLAGMGTKGKDGDNITVTINGGVVVIHPARDDNDLSRVSFTVKAGGKEGSETGPKPSKSALESICGEVARQAKALQIAKFDSKALTAQRDKAIAQMEKRGAEAGDNNDKKDVKSGVGAIKAGHRAGMKLIQGGFKLAGDVLDGQLAFVKACAGGVAPKEEEDKKDDKEDK